MSYPGPPGVAKPSHSSLPPRPPASKLGGFKPAFSPAPVPPAAVSAPGYTAPPSSYPGYGTTPTPVSYGAPPAASPYAAGNPSAPAIGANRGAYGQGPSYNNNYTPQQYPQQTPYYSAPATGSYSTPPQIRNPFPAPSAGAAAVSYDPDEAAQIAQWQSAYMPKHPNDPANTKPATTSGRAGTGTPVGGGAQEAGTATTEAATADASLGAVDANGKKKTVYREGGGKKWQDDSLLEWDPSHLRLFVGNLAGETTDDSLLKAFARWRSVQRAKVVRDKRTTKSKGFGFVSFSDPEDFFQAAKEMNGKYIQSHPVVVRKAKTEVKPAAVKEDRKGKNNKKGGGNKSGSGMGAGTGTGTGTGAGADGAGAYEPHLGPMAGAGITKPGQKMKGGLKLLG
ncbi:RNA-binding domain-containing protein [Parathielavia hyrcaniae]|uniref:RNA-binding domain-containing protein n=1 Tax=Parathielavia hyrcaniae TaxID=113614 RepID=A0AAN6T2G6_9PEZI|nr:RNA-binding domain-containing protein [Parathielavia hyrcaniae]